MSRIEIRPSARRHGIRDDRIRYVVEHCVLPLDNPGWPGQTPYLAPNQYGNPLEVVSVTDDDGVIWAVHAMKLRPAYESDYFEVNGHR